MIVPKRALSCATLLQSKDQILFPLKKEAGGISYPHVVALEMGQNFLQRGCWLYHYLRFSIGCGK
jgi:hypothetical protein